MRASTLRNTAVLMMIVAATCLIYVYFISFFDQEGVKLGHYKTHIKEGYKAEIDIVEIENKVARFLDKLNGYPQLNGVDIRNEDTPLIDEPISNKTENTLEPHTMSSNLPSTPTSSTDKAVKEIQHIAFLKVHKAASSTLQNIFYRFGFRRNLSFVVPKDNHYISKSKYIYNRVLSPMPYFKIHGPEGEYQKYNNTEGKYDILCNHAIFNYDYFKSFLHHDAVYVAIIRDPLQLFLSSAFYYRLVWPNPYLEALNESTFIEQLIRYPEVYEAENISDTHTYNTMTRDFGYPFQSIEDAEQTSTHDFSMFLRDINDIFDLVLVVEQFDESLVMLKRRLQWTFKDILYVKRNSLASTVTQKHIDLPTLSENDTLLFHRRNRFDYMIYNMFLSKFEERIHREKNIIEEVRAFQDVLRTVHTFCNENESSMERLTIEKNTWNREFYVTIEDCTLMLADEIPFYLLIKERHGHFLNGTITMHEFAWIYL